MNIFSVLSYSLNGILFIMLVLNYFQRKKTSIVSLKLQDKLILLESNTILLQDRLKNLDIKKTQLKIVPQVSSSAQSSELLEIRKEASNLKSELKRAKEDSRNKEKELKEIAHVFEQKQYGLIEEKKHMLEQLKLLDRKSLLQKDIERQSAQYKEELSLSQNQQKISLNKLSFAQEKLKAAEKEIFRLKEELSLPLENKNSEISERWKLRALTGKKMYLLMRQMRDLSDSKVLTYEEGIINISEWILKHKNILLPEVLEGENKAERYFAHAWDSILSDNNTNTSSTSHLNLTLQEFLPI